MKKITLKPLSLTATDPLDTQNPTQRPSPVFTVTPNIDTETLLIHASETLASLNAMTTDLAFELEGAHRNVALGIQQMIGLGELLVNRALENLDLPDSAGSRLNPSAVH
ncbi:DUF6124 family protein [Pseudomonas sp. H3(2019)]|uniref:DUF6124 family protein n=1 Tax=Pseudomonas sp. H3(2019) TaxID=2598724 RepID=UPI0011959EE3|nr:DUF6124 family protein [Pseudomonas sp. H3(2019)]TVT83210.1 hypothetical protein FPT12_12745 [Pseudomonas sp. H3(2019)]